MKEQSLLTDNSSTQFQAIKEDSTKNFTAIQSMIENFLRKEVGGCRVVFLSDSLSRQLNLASDINLIVNLPSGKEYLFPLLEQQVEQSMDLSSHYTLKALGLSQWERQLKPADYDLLHQFYRQETSDARSRPCGFSS